MLQSLDVDISKDPESCAYYLHILAYEACCALHRADINNLKVWAIALNEDRRNSKLEHNGSYILSPSAVTFEDLKFKLMGKTIAIEAELKFFFQPKLQIKINEYLKNLFRSKPARATRRKSTFATGCGEVYILHEHGKLRPVKIGRTEVSAESRSKYFSKACISQLVVYDSIRDRMHYKRLETLMHKTFEHVRETNGRSCTHHHREWFDIDAEQAMSILRRWDEWLANNSFQDASKDGSQHWSFRESVPGSFNTFMWKLSKDVANMTAGSILSEPLLVTAIDVPPNAAVSETRLTTEIVETTETISAVENEATVQSTAVKKTTEITTEVQEAMLATKSIFNLGTVPSTCVPIDQGIQQQIRKITASRDAKASNKGSSPSSTPFTFSIRQRPVETPGRKAGNTELPAAFGSTSVFERPQIQATRNPFTPSSTPQKQIRPPLSGLLTPPDSQSRVPIMKDLKASEDSATVKPEPPQDVFRITPEPEPTEEVEDDHSSDVESIQQADSDEERTSTEPPQKAEQEQISDTRKCNYSFNIGSSTVNVVMSRPIKTTSSPVDKDGFEAELDFQLENLRSLISSFALRNT